MPVSLTDVAVRAGVARGTVSSVLNNRSAQARISPRTQERVRTAAAELGYRPNRLAQGLGKGRTNIIGLMIPGLRNPFFLSLLEAAEERAFRDGCDVLPDSAFQLRAAFNAEGKLSGWPVDGVLIWVHPDRSLSDFLGPWVQNIPVVYLGYRRNDDSDYVAIDREGGVRTAMEHLRERGYRRIAYLYPWHDLQPEDSRYIVYEQLCREFGVCPEKIALETLNTQMRHSPITQAGLREAGLTTGLSIAARPKSDMPDAIVCHNDLVAIGLFNGLRRGGITVPDDIAIVGFDGIEEGQYLDKPLTSVESPGLRLIESAMDILRERLDGFGADRPPRQIVLPSTLRIGQTT
ncbi:MAG: LacI family DNA-binding transcriptional regulator [Capsulimonadaceae bacterium]|nr:LacI family DNA-binding transcriptional regulator [Capsulimonadaceae bacterium]